MLVLTRHAQQAIVIGHGDQPIAVRVASVRGGRIRIAIDAPRDIDIRRGESAAQNKPSQGIEPPVTRRPASR